MLLKSIVFTLTLLFVATAAAFAQTNEKPQPKIVSGGVINGKAVELVKPKYPAAAMRVRAGGGVSIQVTVDEQGAVISAIAVSGHPLLKEVSVEAARASRFAPTILSGQPVKLTGVIVYNFIRPMSLIEIGYELATAERSAEAVQNLSFYDMEANLTKDFAEESADLRKLRDKLNGTDRVKTKTEEPKITPNTGRVDVGTENRGTYTLNSPPLRRDDTPVAGKVTPTDATIDDVRFVSNLKSRIESKLSRNPLGGWLFELGVVLAKLDAEIADPQKRALNFDGLSRVTAKAPANAPAALVADLNKLIADEANRQTGTADALRERTRAIRIFTAVR